MIAPEALVAHCRRPVRAASSHKVGLHDFEDAKALYQWMADNEAIGSDDDWRTAGMAARLEFGDAGLELWRLLATRSGGLDERAMTRWRSFDTEATPGCATINSVFDIAHKAGWKGQVRQSLAAMFNVADMVDSPSVAPAAPLPEGTPGPVDLGAEQDAADELAYPTPLRGFLETSAQFSDDFIPPDYVLDGILQRRFLYALTAQTGVGKTTVAMRLAAHVAIGRPLGNVEVERGTVLYFAGENPTDIQMRWLGLTKEMGIDPQATDVVFLRGAPHLSRVLKRVTAEIKVKNLQPALVIVDTAAAYFETDNESDPIQNRDHAMLMRTLCDLPNGPCVVVLCHPTKGAKEIGEMIPRGGSGFVNEIDGNIGMARIEGGPIIAKPIHKFRGREFEGLCFALKTIMDHPRLKDSKGRQIPTVIAEPISAAEVSRREETASKDEDKVLKHLCDNPGGKNSDIGKALGNWHSEKTRRILYRLVEQGLASSIKDRWVSTPKGQKYLNSVGPDAPSQPLPGLTPAVLGPSGLPLPSRPVSPPPMPPG